VIEVLKTDDADEIVRVMNELKRKQSSWELMDFTMELWNKNKTKYPELNWVMLESPVIRIEIADILVQANYNGYVKIEKKEINNYAREVINGPDQMAKSQAVSVIGTLKNEADIPLLRNVALEENPVTFTSAILALSSFCKDQGANALNEINKKLKRTDSKKQFAKILQELKGFKPFCYR
jgi:hypothetical protein